MRLLVIPPPVQPEVYPEPARLPYAGCGSHHVQFRQAAKKPLRDTVRGAKSTPTATSARAAGAPSASTRWGSATTRPARG